MNLPRLSKEQVIKHFYAGSNILVLNLQTNKKLTLNNKETSQLSLSDIQKSNDLIFFLNVPKEFQEFENKRLTEILKYTIGLLPLFVSTGFFVAHSIDMRIRFFPDYRYAALIIGLILSYIGCHFLMKLGTHFLDNDKEFRKKFYL